MESHASRENSAESRRESAAPILNALRLILQRLRASERASRRAVSMGPGQLFVLHCLASEPASSLRDLAKRMAAEPSSVSQVLPKLVDAGLVKRTRDRADFRRELIELTPRGRSMLSKAPTPPQANLLLTLESLPVLENDRILESLSEVARALGTEEATPSLFFEDELASRLPRKAPV